MTTNITTAADAGGRETSVACGAEPRHSATGNAPDDTSARLVELEALVRRLTAEVTDLSHLLTASLPDSSPDIYTSLDARPGFGTRPDRTTDAAGGIDGAEDAHESDEAAPKPIYATVADWVEQHFCIVFARTIGGDTRWCTRWAEHPEAVLRLEALWRSWETLRLDPNLGIATWLTNYLDPQLVHLLGRGGTFASCGSDRHQPAPWLR